MTGITYGATSFILEVMFDPVSCLMILKVIVSPSFDFHGVPAASKVSWWTLLLSEGEKGGGRNRESKLCIYMLPDIILFPCCAKRGWLLSVQRNRWRWRDRVLIRLTRRRAETIRPRRLIPFPRSDRPHSEAESGNTNPQTPIKVDFPPKDPSTLPAHTHWPALTQAGVEPLQEPLFSRPPSLTHLLDA